MFLKRFNNLTVNEKKAFKLYTAHVVLEGIVDGALLLNEFILVKSLFGTNYQISYLFQFSIVILLFSVVTGELLKRTKRKRRLLRRVGIITRLPLVAFAFFPSSTQAVHGNTIYVTLFLAIFFFYYLYKPVILPTVNLLLRFNYTPARFGKLYSYSTQVNKVAVMVSTFAFGLMLDNNHYAFNYVFPILSVVGIISIYLLTLIHYVPPELPEYKVTFWQSVRKSVTDMFAIIKRNKPFRDFEISFMTYGMGWMGTVAIIIIFMDKYLGLNYTSIAFYKNSYHIVSIFLFPFFGRLIGRIDPRKFGIIAFVFFIGYLFFMIFAKYWGLHWVIKGVDVYASVFISFFFYGLFTASMTLLWSVGSSYFCKNEDAAGYQGIHLSMVGFRALFAPIVGVALYEWLGYTGAFAIGIGLICIAALIMFYSYKTKSLNIKFS